MDRTDYVGVGVVFEESVAECVRKVMQADGYSRYDELANYDIAKNRPGVFTGEGLWPKAVAIIPFFEPISGRYDGFTDPQELDLSEMNILIKQDCLRDWCFHNFGLDVHPVTLVVSVWR